MLTSMVLLLFGSAFAGGDAHEGYRHANQYSSAPSAVPDETEEQKMPGNLSLSVSPMRLREPLLELTSEFRVGPTRSLAFIGAMGSGENRAAWMLGGQIREYVLGDFRNGINFGGQFMYGNAAGLGGYRMGYGGYGGNTGGGNTGTLQPWRTTGTNTRTGTNGLGASGMGMNNTGTSTGQVSTPMGGGSLDREAAFGPFMGVKLTLAVFTVEAQGGAQIHYARDRMTLEPIMNVTTGLTF